MPVKAYVDVAVSETAIFEVTEVSNRLVSAADNTFVGPPYGFVKMTSESSMSIPEYLADPKVVIRERAPAGRDNSP